MRIQVIETQKPHSNQALETAIQVGLAALLVMGCVEILYPFVPMIMWGIIIAIASYPAYLRLQRLFKGRIGLVAVVWTLLLLAVLIVPVILLMRSLIAGIQPMAEAFRNGTLVVPPPPESVKTWPLIGSSLWGAWSSASRDLGEALMKVSPQIKAAIPKILSASAGVGGAVLQFVLSILISGVLLANAPAAATFTRSLAIRLFGEQGPEYQQLVGSTIRSVTNGVLGVAVIQTIFASVGFLVIGLPGAAVWSAIFLVAAILQIGVVVLIPAAVFGFAVASKTAAVFFLTWCIIVGLMDNVLKPLLLGRGAAVPLAVVFLGVIGGFMAMGIIGLFVGAIVLSVGYKLFLAWINGSAPPREAHVSRTA